MHTACASKNQNLSSPSASYRTGLQAALAASPADWDPTDAVWRRIPLAGWMIEKVRARL